ncbi:hypothetical protein KY285_000667 [Solanum tuberosum]|nr:hypothetical protein KY285_000667 [Solanum tuberosum]
MVFPLLTAALSTPPDIWCQIVAPFLISLIIKLAIFVASIVQVREEGWTSGMRESGSGLYLYSRPINQFFKRSVRLWKWIPPLKVMAKVSMDSALWKNSVLGNSVYDPPQLHYFTSTARASAGLMGVRAGGFFYCARAYPSGLWEPGGFTFADLAKSAYDAYWVPVVLVLMLRSTSI